MSNISTFQNKFVPLADLELCHSRIREELDQAWRRVMDRSTFIYGPEVEAFEAEMAAYLGVKHVISCANGTDALIGALISLDLPPGSEVIGPDFTFIAPLEAIIQARHRPVLVDIDPHTFTIDPEKLRAAITANTRAIIAVHINGQCADMERILSIASEYNIPVIEDSAQGMGAEYFFSNGVSRKAGTMGHIATTSFFPSKNLAGIGDGGAVFTDDDNLARRIRCFFAHGKSGNNYSMIGINSRLDGIQAAVLRVKLRYLPDFTRRRQDAAAFYDDGFGMLPWLQCPTQRKYSTHTYHKYSVIVHDNLRSDFMNHLKANRIDCKIYYSVPVHQEPSYQEICIRAGDLRVAERVCEGIVSIPMHSELSEDDLQRVTTVVQSFR